MFTKNHFKTKLIIDDVSKVHNYGGVSFGTRVCTHTICVDDYFFLRITSRTLPPTNYGIVNIKEKYVLLKKGYCC